MISGARGDMPLHTIQGEAELRERCRTLLEGLEVWLRRLIHDRLTDVYGPDYLTAKDGDGNSITAGELRRRLSGRQDPESLPATPDQLMPPI